MPRSSRHAHNVHLGGAWDRTPGPLCHKGLGSSPVYDQSWVTPPGWDWGCRRWLTQTNISREGVAGSLWRSRRLEERSLHRRPRSRSWAGLGFCSGAHNCCISLLPHNRAPRNSTAQNKPFLPLMNLQPRWVLVDGEGALQGGRGTPGAASQDPDNPTPSAFQALQATGIQTWGRDSAGKPSPYRIAVNVSSSQWSEMGGMGLDQKRPERETSKGRHGLQVQVHPAAERKALLRHLGALLGQTRIQRKGTNPRSGSWDGASGSAGNAPTLRRRRQRQDVRVCSKVLQRQGGRVSGEGLPKS